jgi:hypothetical protein
MKLLKAEVVGVGPFERLVLPFADDQGEARPLTVIHGAGGVGKSSLLAAIACTRPGHCVAIPSRAEARATTVAPFAACHWALGRDEPQRPHPLSLLSPNARSASTDEAEALRRREQLLFDRLAVDGGFAFLAIASNRWFSRQPLAFSAPARTVARYDVRANPSGDETTRADLGREIKQALAYAEIGAALAPLARPSEHRLDLLASAMRAAVDAILRPVGTCYRGLDPVSFEPLFLDRGRELPFDALATRVRHLVALAALSVRTLWAAYPDRDPRDVEGVITIDEPDLHQDTQTQQQLLGHLREMLPEAQWILATSSPVLAGCAEAGAVLALRPVVEGSVVHVFAGDQARTH